MTRQTFMGVLFYSLYVRQRQFTCQPGKFVHANIYNRYGFQNKCASQHISVHTTCLPPSQPQDLEQILIVTARFSLRGAQCRQSGLAC